MGKDNLSDVAVIALGGNQQGEHCSLEAALVAAVTRLGEVGFEPVRLSRWWRSAAWPEPNDPPFLNGVMLARTELSPNAAMAALHAVEAEFGRRRSLPNAPRTLDLDLIALGRTVMDGELVLPHPRATERLFVMGPLAEIAPDWRHPVTGESAEILASRATIGQDAVPQ